MKIAFGCDHAGVELKDVLSAYLHEKGYEIVDLGCYDSSPVDYPVYALEVASSVKRGEADRGILICGTGIGMSIAANKVNGIRCAHLTDTFSARVTCEHNDANVIALGARITGRELAKDIVDAYLSGTFTGVDAHVKRLKMIADIEKQH